MLELTLQIKRTKHKSRTEEDNKKLSHPAKKVNVSFLARWDKVKEDKIT